MEIPERITGHRPKRREEDEEEEFYCKIYFVTWDPTSNENGMIRGELVYEFQVCMRLMMDRKIRDM